MAEVINDILGYNGIKVIQDSNKFNFSLDSTLLANFVKINKPHLNILDIGCGNGFIPLFLSLKTNNHITGIDIQEELVDMAQRSVKLNKLEHQITILNKDIRTYYLEVGVSKFDIITSNPPYFPYLETNKFNKNDYLTIARHEIHLNINELLDAVRKLLKDNGTFYMVHRSDRLADIIEAFRNYGIELKRIQFVYPKRSSNDALLLLIEGKKTKKKGGLKVLKPLYVHKVNGDYSKEVLKIFNYQGKQNETTKKFYKG